VLEQGAAPHNIETLLSPEPGLPPLPPLCVLPPVPTAPPVPGASPTQALRVHSNWPSLQVQVLQLSEAEVVFPSGMLPQLAGAQSLSVHRRSPLSEHEQLLHLSIKTVVPGSTGMPWNSHWTLVFPHADCSKSTDA